MKLTPGQVIDSRKLLGWSRTRLASRVGLTDTSLATFETGQRCPSTINHDAIKEALETAGIVFAKGNKPSGCNKKSPT
jgi:DNA-binding XRE family transcriptional regulator